MKLLTKLTLYNTLSKTAVVILFILLLPGLVNDVAFQYTNYALLEQKRKVLRDINKNGIEYYFQGDSSYGSYTMLKEEYISLEPATGHLTPDTIETSPRIVENDTLSYRVLKHTFEYGQKKYLLEIGKTVAVINQYNRPLQHVALYVLVGLIVCTLLIDLIFTRILIRPLGVIIKTKLLNRKFPFNENILPVKTSTADFKYLDDSLISLMNKIKEAFEKEREFTSNASHELLTPVGILQNKMENLMVENELTEELQEKISGMMNTLNRLKKIVRSLMLISRIENDQFAKLDRINAYELIAEVIKELDDRLDAKKIRISLDISRGKNLKFLNRELLFQLFYNLVNNAIKYNLHNGEIKISEKIIPHTSYTIFIEDSGIGINQNELGVIFDRFKKTGAGGEEGYGLGLSIVKSIVRYHEIGIDVKSEYGKRTIFSIIFPARMLELTES